jgi:hypothetical protein
MKAGVVALVGVALVAVVGVIAYPSARASYVRSRAETHIQQADAMRAAVTSPVAKEALSRAANDVRFAHMRPDVTTADIARLDAELVTLMTSLERSPLPDSPVETTASFETTAQAGAPFLVKVQVRSHLAEGFLVGITAQVSVGQAWSSAPVRKKYETALGTDPISVDIPIDLPPDVSGAATVRVITTYRLNPTGEGRDLHSEPASLPGVTIQPKAK